jgi:hypothetical protein
MKYQVILENSRKYQEISCGIRIPRKTISENIRKYHEIPRNTMTYFYVFPFLEIHNFFFLMSYPSVFFIFLTLEGEAAKVGLKINEKRQNII